MRLPLLYDICDESDHATDDDSQRYEEYHPDRIARLIGVDVEQDTGTRNEG
jgi:hypothetical protein